ncbi:Gp62 [Mycolicibacterium canariasense]|uniref:Gp62 n=1 Tax=Mycolicibacterium canariasense TaxID=228230 RepID=A0A100WA79_MYCCR|nr:hypothetical protein [Mycolicibacterium canariasense]MCV7208809.1 hypothetical protein [Mycolicibacterium canariasense]ORV07126.1 hypothetical protein AWB94_14080 [Mycolicibacterium canariasense]GAS94403.1 Gp62 [Mycolicibacterium canariasense]
MRTAALAIAIILTVAGCGDHPVPEHGRVTDARYSPATVIVQPMTCVGQPPICTGPFITPVPEEWRLEITDLKNPEWVGTVEVSQDVYNRCNLQELWPECSREGSGDERPNHGANA